jgi:hypothetical protein
MMNTGMSLSSTYVLMTSIPSMHRADQQHRTEFQLEKEGIIREYPDFLDDARLTISASRASRSNGRLGIERARRGTANYYNRQNGAEDSSDDDGDDESEYETDTSIDAPLERPDIKPVPLGEGQGGDTGIPVGHLILSATELSWLTCRAVRKERDQ